MEVNVARRDDPTFGSVTIVFVSQETWALRQSSRPSESVKHEQYTWSPPADLDLENAPAHGKVIFDVYTGEDGYRRFFRRDVDGDAGYVASAFQAGESLLKRDLNLQREARLRYLVDKLLFDRVQNVRERLKASFRSAADLEIRSNLQQLLGRRDVLPEEIGLDADGKGCRWTVQQLLDNGRRAAQEDGFRACTEAEAISYGLMEAARLRPATGKDGVDALMRYALFDFSRTEAGVSADLRQDVRQRFTNLAIAHLADSAEKWQKFLQGGNGNLAKSLARKAGHQPLELPEVRRAILDLGLDGFHTVGECLEKFAATFLEALPTPLNDIEQARFGAMYFRQPYLGGLPLPLLLARRAIIQPALFQIWYDPGNERHVGVLHAVLDCFSGMAAVRREADRVRKAGALRMRAQATDVASLPPRPDQLHEILGEILERRNVLCPECRNRLWGEMGEMAGNIAPGNELTVNAFCEQHGLICTQKIAWTEFEEIALRVREG